MEYQLNIRLGTEKKGYFWQFESQEDTMTLFDEVVETFKSYEPKNKEVFMEEKKKEMDETGKSHTVQIEVTKNESPVIIRSASYGEMWYEGRHFDDFMEILTNKLGTPEEQQVA